MYAQYFHKTTTPWLLPSCIYLYIFFYLTVIKWSKQFAVSLLQCQFVPCVLIWVFMLHSYYIGPCPPLINNFSSVIYLELIAILIPFSTSLAYLNSCQHFICQLQHLRPFWLPAKVFLDMYTLYEYVLIDALVSTTVDPAQTKIHLMLKVHSAVLFALLFQIWWNGYEHHF